MNHEDELKQAEEAAMRSAKSLEQNEFSQVKQLYRSIKGDKGNFSEEQMESFQGVLALAQGIKGAIECFAYDGGFRRTYILDVEAYTRQMREEDLSILASIDDEKVREYCNLAERLCQEAERLIAAVDLKFITDKRGRKKTESS